MDICVCLCVCVFMNVFMPVSEKQRMEMLSKFLCDILCEANHKNNKAWMASRPVQGVILLTYSNAVTDLASVKYPSGNSVSKNL